MNTKELEQTVMFTSTDQQQQFYKLEHEFNMHLGTGEKYLLRRMHHYMAGSMAKIEVNKKEREIFNEQLNATGYKATKEEYYRLLIDNQLPKQFARVYGTK